MLVPKNKSTAPATITGVAPSGCSLPKFGEWLLYIFLRRKERLIISADLAEDYREAIVKFGPISAQIDFYAQVGISLWPVVRRLFVRLSVIFGGVKLLGWLAEIVVKFSAPEI